MASCSTGRASGTPIVAFAVLLAFYIGISTGCRKPVALPTPDVQVATLSKLPDSPDDAAWSGISEHVSALLLQDIVEPRLMDKSTAEVRVRAATDGRSIAFRLEWRDASQNDINDAGRFADACAVQLPAKIEATVPAPQMGEEQKPVEIAYWNAVWQAMVDGRADTIRAIHPHAAIDHYPFQAAPLGKDTPDQKAMALRYAPARALGNMMAGPRDSPVQDLVARGPGTIAPADQNRSTGRGERTDDGWAVVIVRPLPDRLTASSGGQVAFAVWQGEANEAGSRKMRTGWVTLKIRD